MITVVKNIYESLRKPQLKEVYFRSLPLNRNLLFWYANRIVKNDSTIDSIDQLTEIDRLRCSGQPLTFISNHLTYADSHVIEIMFIRAGFKDMADHIIHIAGQKTFDLSRRFLTRSLNTIRVYQPKAKIDRTIKKKMNSRALRWAARQKRKGYSLLVFPEGTRSRMQKRFNLKGGNPRTTIYFRNSLVVPLALMGSEEMMPVGRVLPEAATIHLRIGKPIIHSDLEKELRLTNGEQSEKELQQTALQYYMNQINNLLRPEYRFDEAAQVPGK
ncbi:MAG TPA: lysophospholipid acyltransferase family protein [Acidobacteriota bacterium]